VVSVRTAAISLALATLVAAAGCGQSEDRDQVRDVAARFATALANDDGAVACEQLSDATIETLEQQEQAPCAQAVTELALDRGAVTRVRVYVTGAQAVYDDGGIVFLDRARDGWRLSAVGCRFEDGKPQSRPATCEAES
jgi:hypothetical protein